MNSRDPIFENHLAFLESHRGRLSSDRDRWIDFAGDSEFLSFGSPQSPEARPPERLEAPVWLYPWAGEAWADWLNGAGHQTAEQLSYMELAKTTVRSGSDAVEIRIVDSEKAAREFAGVQARGFIGPDSAEPSWWREKFLSAAIANYGRPDQTFYIGSFEGEPAGVLLSVTTGATSGIYAVATGPAFRNRGVSSALLARCCADFAGNRIVLQVAADSYAEGFYRRLGFVERYRLQVWRAG